MSSNLSAYHTVKASGLEFPNYKLDSKEKARWVKALRSGKFKQGTSRLTMTAGRVKGRFAATKHCCLGVYCHIIGLPKRIQGGYAYGVVMYGDTESTKRIRSLYETGHLPVTAYRKLGANSNNPLIFWANDRNGVQQRYTATILNDEIGLTFPQIADCINYFL